MGSFSILLSELNRILPLNDINFDIANINSQNSILVQCCTLWEEGKTSGEICKLLNIGDWLVSTYLKKGSKYGLCNYDSTASIRRSFCKPIICINNKEIYETILDASKKYKVCSKGISHCLKNIDYSAGKDNETGEKLFWMYLEDYEKLSKEKLKQYVYDKILYGKSINASNPVVNVFSNKLYLSLTSAVKDSGVFYKTINDYCNTNTNININKNNITIYKRSWMRLENYIQNMDPNNLDIYGFNFD